MELIPPCQDLHFTHESNIVFGSCSFPVSCVWLSSVARSCATRNASKKDNVWKPTIPAGITRPPPSETISHVTRVPDHQTRLAGLQDSCLFRTRDPVREYIFIYDGIGRAKNLEHRRRRRVIAGRTAGVTRPGAGATRQPRHQSRR